PRSAGPQPRDALRLARSGSQTRLAARVAEPPRPPLGSHYHVHRLASVGGAPAPRRPAARTTRITDSPRGARRRASAPAARLALPHRGFFEGSPVPGRVGEGDRADRRERDTGVTVRGDVRAPGGGVTDRAEPAGERLGDLAIAVEGPHTFTEAAPHEHRTVEGEREIARQLRTERRSAGPRSRRRRPGLPAAPQRTRA